MKTFISAGLVWGGMLLSFSVYGQRIVPKQYAPLGALPLQFNGSFAGEAGAPRISHNSLFTSSDIAGFYKSRSYVSSFSYDQFIPRIGTGIGFSANIGSGQFEYRGSSQSTPDETRVSDLSFGLDIAPKFSIKGKYTLSPSISVQYIKLQYEGARNILNEGFSTRVGLLWNSSKYYIGFAFNGFHSIEYNGTKHPYQFISHLQSGYTFQRTAESNFSFTPQLFILLTNPYRDSEDSFLNKYVQAYHLNFRYKKFIWGLNNYGVHIGLQNERLRITLTNDVGIFNKTSSNNLLESRSYIGNLSFRYVFQ